MRILRRTRAPSLLALGVLALGLSLCASPANADILFFTGQNIPQAGDENVLLNTGLSAGINQPLFGVTNQTGFLVQFQSSTDAITAPANGQARVEAQSGVLNQITVSLPGGGSFTSLIANNFFGVGTLTVGVLEPNGDLSQRLHPLGVGSNFITIVAVNNQRIATVSFNPDPGAGAFEALQQVRIGGAQGGTLVPEPMSMTLMGAGMLPFIPGLRRRLRRKGQEEEPAAV